MDVTVSGFAMANIILFACPIQLSMRAISTLEYIDVQKGMPQDREVTSWDPIKFVQYWTHLIETFWDHRIRKEVLLLFQSSLSTMNWVTGRNKLYCVSCTTRKSLIGSQEVHSLSGGITSRGYGFMATNLVGVYTFLMSSPTPTPTFAGLQSIFLATITGILELLNSPQWPVYQV